MLTFIFKVLRAGFLLALAAAVGAKFLLESHAEPDTEDIDLVSIFDGKHLVSTAAPFHGGNILSMFGGTLLDLTGAKPAPTGVFIDLAVVMGGVSIVVPEGWRVYNKSNFMAGGFSDVTRTDSSDEAPSVTLTGFVLMGGVQVSNESPIKESASVDSD